MVEVADDEFDLGPSFVAFARRTADGGVDLTRPRADGDRGDRTRRPSLTA
jgi:hypothetical protein